MEDIKNESVGVKRGILSIFKGATEASGAAEDVAGRREGSDGTTGRESVEVEKEDLAEAVLEKEFPIKLINPGGDIFKPYGEAVEVFLKEITLSEDIITEEIQSGAFKGEKFKFTEKRLRDLTITKMMVPSFDAPTTYITPYCGFPVIKGDIFSVQLNNGALITV